MKTFALIVGLLIVCVGNSGAQQKGDNAVILVCKDSAETLFKKLGKHLLAKGYAIEKSDPNFLTIKTEQKQSSKYNYGFVLNVSVDGHNVIIMGKWRINHPCYPQFNQWYFKSKDNNAVVGTPLAIFYNDLMNAISDFDYVEIGYKKM